MRGSHQRLTLICMQTWDTGAVSASHDRTATNETFSMNYYISVHHKMCACTKMKRREKNQHFFHRKSDEIIIRITTFVSAQNIPLDTSCPRRFIRRGCAYISFCHFCHRNANFSVLSVHLFKTFPFLPSSDLYAWWAKPGYQAMLKIHERLIALPILNNYWPGVSCLLV